MNDLEKRLSDYIDSLNEEKEPEEQWGVADTPELEKLLATARTVRSLKEPALPGPGYPEQLARTVFDRLTASEKRTEMQKAVAPRRPVRNLPSVAALAACLLLVVILSAWSGLLKSDVVYAMEKAVARLSNYHGILEMRSINADGEEWPARRVELWWERGKYAVRHDDGSITVNNGKQKWQVQPQNKVVALWPAIPDPVKTGFDLRDEAARAKAYPHRVAGSELVAGREAVKLEILPPGGLPYYLWIDRETNMPVQLQTAMQNSLQTIYTFTLFEPNSKLNEEVFAFQVPEGYVLVEEDPGQLVATLKEAAAISGFSPLAPREAPGRILAFKDRVVLDYGETIIVETAAKGTFEPEPNASLGTAAGGPWKSGGKGCAGARVDWRSR